MIFASIPENLVEVALSVTDLLDDVLTTDMMRLGETGPDDSFQIPSSDDIRRVINCLVATRYDISEVARKVADMIGTCSYHSGSDKFLAEPKEIPLYLIASLATELKRHDIDTFYCLDDGLQSTILPHAW